MSGSAKVRWVVTGLLGLAISVALAPARAQGSGDAQQGAQPAQNQTQQQNQSQQQMQDQTPRGKPLTLAPDEPGMARNHRLILKDGSFQSVRQYQVIGDRVKYLSQDRGDWEELPVSLVDWDATRKWELDHAATETTEEEPSPAMKEAEGIDRDEAAVRNEQSARMPEVAKGLELPDRDGVFALDTYQGTPELVEIKSSEMSLNVKDKRGVAALDPLAGEKGGLELEGAHARVYLHVNDPAIYISLGVEETVEPPRTHAITVNTAGAGAGRTVKRGAQSAQSGFALVRLDERREVRLVGAIHVSASGKVTQDEDVVPAKVEVMAGKHWLKIEPETPLKIGEYALVEILSPTEISPTAWGFREDPTLPDNKGSIGPIEKTSR
jgi:hypothetical protein